MKMQLNKKQNSLIEDLKKLKLYGMAGDLEKSVYKWRRVLKSYLF